MKLGTLSDSLFHLSHLSLCPSFPFLLPYSFITLSFLFYTFLSVHLLFHIFHFLVIPFFLPLSSFIHFYYLTSVCSLLCSLPTFSLFSVRLSPAIHLGWTIFLIFPLLCPYFGLHESSRVSPFLSPFMSLTLFEISVKIVKSVSFFLSLCIFRFASFC